MKKLTRILFCALLALTLAGCSTKPAPTPTPTPIPTEEAKQNEQETITLTISVIDTTQENKVLFEGNVEVPAECKTLADVLLAAEELQLKSEESQYGMAILGMMGVEGNWDKGPWWLYESENNAACAAAGFCDGASALEVADGDIFTFKLTSDF